MSGSIFCLIFCDSMFVYSLRFVSRVSVEWEGRCIDKFLLPLSLSKTDTRVVGAMIFQCIWEGVILILYFFLVFDIVAMWWQAVSCMKRGDVAKVPSLCYRLSCVRCHVAIHWSAALRRRCTMAGLMSSVWLNCVLDYLPHDSGAGCSMSGWHRMSCTLGL